ncbi:hypothetical protein DDZ13_05030 [Coraliomargarita sinensis]|uniref:HTH gntR-type domain-containing protein n=1 Tax=Coraliomargarita sinensis TaxID=2174842 RepID=A0A317ZHU0_9BACT|nr:substrate-binding domain-containing protein [Coraliomargarita sinensis]PXA04542.1 hypothetical protein DDZ13_05030 [Coraliomargarita sinensis]
MSRKPFKLLSAPEQVALYLRDEITSGRWQSTMPGIIAIASEFGVHRTTAEEALKLLEHEGLVMSQGAGKPRKITLAKTPEGRAARVSVILYEREDALNRSITELRHQLLASGHSLSFAPKSLVELNHDPRRVARMVESHPAELWIIQAGSKPVLEWFAQSPYPALALFGRMKNVPIAGTGPDKIQAIRDAVQHLVAQGHRRIVFLVRAERRKPKIGTVEQIYLEQLEASGIKTGAYNLPDWEESPEGFHDCLDQLFRATPPTAFLVGDWMLFLTLQNYLGWVKKEESGEIALICTDYNPAFKWCHPPIAHVYWDHRATARQVARWVNKAAQGKNDHRQRMTKASFVRGATA